MFPHVCVIQDLGEQTEQHVRNVLRVNTKTTTLVVIVQKTPIHRLKVLVLPRVRAMWATLELTGVRVKHANQGFLKTSQVQPIVINVRSIQPLQRHPIISMIVFVMLDTVEIPGKSAQRVRLERTRRLQV